MDPFGLKITIIAGFVATVLAVRGYTKQSLSKKGAITGWIIGFIIVSTGLRGMVLFYFYQIGSWATKYKHTLKSTFDTTVSTSSCRGPNQVLAVSIIATTLSIYHAIQYGPEQPIDFINNSLSIGPSSIACALIAHHATGLADTLASELGMLAKYQPILITQPWRTVPTGTNGGVTITGFLWSAIGGAVIGILVVAMDNTSGLSPLNNALRVTLFGACCGVLGSIIDSLLGATIQATYYDGDTKQIHRPNRSSNINNSLPKSATLICGMDILTNEQVNFVSMAITSLIGGWFLGPWFFA